MPHVKFVVLDTLAKVLRANDSGSYDEMLKLCEQLHLLARESKVHIQALAHCKKVQPEDPFDGFLGSVEVRAETDTNIILYDSRGKRLLQSETRMGTPWEPTEICAEMATIGKSQMVKRFYFGETQAKVAAEQTVAQEENIRSTMKVRIIAALKAHNGEWESAACFDSIVGARAMKFDVRKELIRDKVIRMAGLGTKASPQRLILLQPDWSPSAVKVMRVEPPVEPVEPQVEPIKSPEQVQRERLEKAIRDLQSKATRFRDGGVPRLDLEEDIVKFQAQLNAMSQEATCMN